MFTQGAPPSLTRSRLHRVDGRACEHCHEMVPVVDSVCCRKTPPNLGSSALKGMIGFPPTQRIVFNLLFLLLVLRTQCLPAHPV